MRLANSAFADLYHFYDLPMWSSAGSDAHTFDTQGAWENAMGILMASLDGANLIHDVAYLGQGLLGNPAMIVLCDEQISYVRRILAGIGVDRRDVGGRDDPRRRTRRKLPDGGSHLAALPPTGLATHARQPRQPGHLGAEGRLAPRGARDPEDPAHPGHAQTPALAWVGCATAGRDFRAGPSRSLRASSSRPDSLAEIRSDCQLRLLRAGVARVATPKQSHPVAGLPSGRLSQ